VRQVLLAPVVSEKSYNQIDENRYTFKVHKDAHRLQVRQAVEELFGRPRPERQHGQGATQAEAARMQKGRKPGWKKAVVQIRAGEAIEIFGGAQV
jgi:large subunit ribosomal protein L23